MPNDVDQRLTRPFTLFLRGARGGEAQSFCRVQCELGQQPRLELTENWFSGLVRDGELAPGVITDHDRYGHQRSDRWVSLDGYAHARGVPADVFEVHQRLRLDRDGEEPHGSREPVREQVARRVVDELRNLGLTAFLQHEQCAERCSRDLLRGVDDPLEHDLQRRCVEHLMGHVVQRHQALQIALLGRNVTHDDQRGSVDLALDHRTHLDVEDPLC